MKSLLKFLAIVLLVLVVVVVARTLMVPSKQSGPLPHTPEGFDAQRLAT